MAYEKHTDIKPRPLQGGCNTVLPKSLIPFGKFSMVQNFRGKHPGFEKRAGMAVGHTQADSTNEVLSVYQFSKGRRTERHFFVQMSDDDVLEATTAPPGTTTGEFGSQVFAGTATSIPASYSNLNDLMLYSDGTSQHKIYAGTANYVRAFIKYANATTAAPNVPTEGFDYTWKVNNTDSSQVAVLDSLNVYGGDTTYHCIFICTPIPANRLYWTMKSGKENSTAAVGTLSYWNGSTWYDTGESDGTIAATGKTLGQSGAMTWDFPADEVPKYMYGISGFWYQWKTATQLDSEVEVQTVTYGTDGKTSAGSTTHHFRSIVNVWDGVLKYAIEAQLDHDSKYYTYATGSVEIGLMDENDKLYISSTDPLLGVYLDVGDTPANGDIAAIDAAYYWDGDGWVSLSTITDGTNGLDNSGWVTWAKPSGTPQPSQFRTSQYQAYWYYLEIDDAASGEGTPTADDIVMAIYTMPYFDINEIGVVGHCNAAWKNRGIYSFGDQYLYVSANGKPMSLNGDDFAILEAGDGRNNEVVNMKRFYNELLVFQEEKGKEGGCITLFEGFDPNTFGKVVLSSQIGTLNSKSAVIVDGVFTATETDKLVKTMGFTLSHYGVFETDGISVNAISDNIANYFNPQASECIRRGYESKCWLSYDSSVNCLLLGLVSGEPIMTSTATSTTSDKLVDTAGAFTTRKTVTGFPISHKVTVGDTVYNTTDSTSALITAIDSATQLTLDTDIMASGEAYVIYASTANLFPVFDLTEREWYFDLRQYSLSCITEVEAASGNLPILQYGGGTNDGTVYRLNTETNDVSTAINSYVDIELNALGEYLLLNETLTGVKVQAAGNLELSINKQEVAHITDKTLSMTAALTGETTRRHLVQTNAEGHHLTVRLKHDTPSQSCLVEYVGFKTEIYKER